MSEAGKLLQTLAYVFLFILGVLGNLLFYVVCLIITAASVLLATKPLDVTFKPFVRQFIKTSPKFNSGGILANFVKKNAIDLILEDALHIDDWIFWKIGKLQIDSKEFVFLGIFSYWYSKKSINKIF